MQTTRRSFLASLVAAVVLSPVVCRLFAEKPGWKTYPFPEHLSELELWEQESDWDGTLSPYFLSKYGITGDFAPFKSKEEKLIAGMEEHNENFRKWTSENPNRSYSDYLFEINFNKCS